MTDEQLNELERLASNATDGPLSANKGDEDEPDRWHILKSSEPHYLVATIENGAPGDTLDTEESTARLFAASRSAIPAIIAEIRRLRAPQWRSMNSAPKDGRMIMLFSDKQGFHQAFWDNFSQSWLTCPNHRNVWHSIYSPGKWQPLPEPPKEGE